MIKIEIVGKGRFRTKTNYGSLLVAMSISITQLVLIPPAK
jgi:hypothetical protein